jgi:hypothetical protein
MSSVWLRQIALLLILPDKNMPGIQEISPEEKAKYAKEIEDQLDQEEQYEDFEAVGRSERSMSRGRRGGRGGKGIGRERRRHTTRK